jgi:purine nucleosidase
MPRTIIVDTDPSPDDAVAFLVALGSPEELDLAAITTVGGNVSLAHTTRNALKALELAGRPEVPVHPGAAGPLIGPLVTAEHVHGPTGFEGFDLPEPTIAARPEFAPRAIVDIVMGRPEKSVTLCCLAPLTNIALALAECPEIAPRLAEIVLMGGARTEGGNITPAAEYNIAVDPEAAEKVLACGAPITMIPLDCTHRALTTRARLAKLRAYGTPIAEAFWHLLEWNKRFDEGLMGTDGGPLHDPTVTAFLLRPEIFRGRRVNVEIERAGTFTRGQTVVDWWGTTGRPKNVFWIHDLDADAYFDLVFERLVAAERRG